MILRRRALATEDVISPMQEVIQSSLRHLLPQEQCQSPAVRLPVFERANKVAQGELGAGGTEKAVIKVVKTVDPVRTL